MLEPGCLKYSVEKHGLVKDSFILSQCTMRLCSDDPVRLDIDVVGRGLVCLRTDTPSEKHRWFVAFKKAQKILFQAYQKKVLTPSGVYSIEGISSPYPQRESIPPGLKPPTVSHPKITDVTNELPGSDVIAGIDEQRTISIDIDDLGSNESASVDVSELFLRTKIGQEPQTALNCMLRNTSCLDEITKKILDELRELASGDLLKKVETLSLVAKEYCASMQFLYVEEVRSRKELEQSLFKVTRRNMKLENQEARRSTRLDPNRPTASLLDQMHVSNKYHEIVGTDSDSSESAYCGHIEEEFFECEDLVRSSLSSLDVHGSEKGAPSVPTRAKEAPTQAKEDVESEPALEEVAEDEADETQVPIETPKPQESVNKEPRVIKRRTRLPMHHNELSFSLWSILKDLIGKDLSRICMPIYLNEPTSTLQRSAEDYEYAELLNTAAQKSDPVDRMLYVTLFSISPYQSTVARTYKPFNPLLGETYELTHRGYKYIAEQVGHHPPITAFHCHNDYFESYGSTNALVRLTGKSVEVSIIGPFLVNLITSEEKEMYKLQRCYVVVHNIVFGKMWIEVVGTAVLRNVTNGEFSVVQYLRKGWFDKEMHKVRSLVFDRFGTPKYYLSGKWSEVVYVESVSPPARPQQKKVLLEDGSLDYDKSLYKSEEDAWDAFVNEIPWEKLDLVPGSRKEIWRPNQRPSDHELYYGFGYMTIELNELTEDYDPAKGAVIPPTDSRLRTDLRAYENGDMTLASAEKTRLEDRQREIAKKRIDGEKSYQPVWFHKNVDPDTCQTTFDFKGTYWQKKADGTIAEGIRDLFEK